MQWVCEICGYVHDEEELPEMCPVCGAPKSKFSEWSEDDTDFLNDETVDDEDSFEDDLYGDYDE
ncbi:MAG TPA: hypothetical protein VJ983_04020 [candidate division Zixibacteria bacterium]|jgi:rubredoxin|nr:hypothetical protein [candidate division Zixibacteria bacterium]